MIYFTAWMLLFPLVTSVSRKVDHSYREASPTALTRRSRLELAIYLTVGLLIFLSTHV